MARGATGQQHLLKSKAARILPRCTRWLDNPLRAALHEAYNRQEATRMAYADAEALLKSALGLDKLDLMPRLSYERPYADVQTAAPFDAEYGGGSE